MPGILTAFVITYAITAIFAIIAFGWREELKALRKIHESTQAAKGER